MNLLLNELMAIASGTSFPFVFTSATVRSASRRIHAMAFSWELSSQFEPGNSAHGPTRSWCSSDHVSRLAYQSISIAYFKSKQSIAT
ncbi:MAG: hypothetical protein AB7Q97_15840 [Gammaproteobacteria bacterium]